MKCNLPGLDIKPLMLLKHPTCLETIKRMRAYVGNTPSWELSESAALVFTKQAHRIRKQADSVYKKMKVTLASFICLLATASGFPRLEVENYLTGT